MSLSYTYINLRRNKETILLEFTSRSKKIRKADDQFSDKHYTNMIVSSIFQSIVAVTRLHVCFASNSKLSAFDSFFLYFSILLHFSCTEYVKTSVDANANSEIERLLIMMNIKIK